MTLQIPQGASTVKLPTGMEVQVPNGATQMDIPDNLIQQKQFSGGLNQPETKGWAQDEIENELSSPFGKFMNSIIPSKQTVADTFNKAEHITGQIPKSPAEFLIRQGLSTNPTTKKAYEATDVQQYAIDAMKEVDTLDASSKWSEIYKTLKDQGRPEAEEAKQRLYKAYDDAFKQRDIGRLGKAEDGELFLIQKNGEHLSLDSLVDGLQGDMKANKGVIGAGIAGGLKGAEYGSKLHPVYGSILGGLVGSAAATFGGSMADTALNSYKNLRDFDGQFALEKAGQEALVDGAIGGTLEAGIKGVKAGYKALSKLPAQVENISGAKTFANKAGVSDDTLESILQQYDEFETRTTPTLTRGGATEQDALNAAANQNPALATAKAKELGQNIEGATAQLQEVDARAKNVLKNLEESASTPEELRANVESYVGRTKADYGEMVDSLTQLVPDAKIDITPVLKELENMGKGLTSVQAKADIDQLIDGLVNRGANSIIIPELMDARHAINRIISKQQDHWGKQQATIVKQRLDEVLDLTLDATPIGEEAKTAMRDTIARYAEMKQLEDNGAFKQITKKDATPESIDKALVKHSQTIEQTLKQVTDKLPYEQRAGAEIRIIKGIVDKASKIIDGGTTAIDFPKIAEILKGVQTTTKEAKETIDTLTKMGDLFKHDVLFAQASKDTKAPAWASGIGVDLIMKMRVRTMNKIMSVISRYLPDTTGQSLAFRYHVMQSTKRARTPNELFKMIIEHPEVPPTLIKQLRPLIKEYAEQKQAEKEQIELIEAQKREAKANETKAQQEELNTRAKDYAPDMEELRVLSDMTSTNNEKQAVLRMMDGKALESDNAMVLALKEKLGAKYDDALQSSRDKKANLEKLRQEAQQNAKGLESQQGSVQTGKADSWKEINNKHAGDEDKMKEAHRAKFEGKSATEYQGTTEQLTKKEVAELQSGEASEETLLKYKRIQDEMEGRGIDIPKQPTSGNALIDGVVNTPKSKPMKIEGTATDEEAKTAKNLLKKDTSNWQALNQIDELNAILASIDKPSQSATLEELLKNLKLTK